MSEELVEAEVMDAAAELEPAATQTLFRTDDPATVLQRATETADALAPALREKGMVANIQGKEHVQVEGWQTLGAMLGVTPVTTATRKVDNGWEATVEARTLDGRVIGAAESMCSRDEGHWKDSDEYAIRSMAQTRATSRALASVLRFVVTLAGFSGTPAEEMGGRGYSGGGERAASKKQIDYAANLVERAKFSEDQLVAIHAFCKGEGGKFKAASASFLIENLKDGTEDGRNRVLEQVGAPNDVPFDATDLPEPDTSDFQGEGEQKVPDEDLPTF